MTRLDQVLLQLRAQARRIDTQEKRLDALEAGARPAPRKRERAPRPSDSVVSARQTLWARLVLLHVEYGHGRLTKLKIVIKYHLGDPSDLCRFLSAADKRGVAEGSAPAVRYYQALKEAIAELEARRVAHGQHLHGNATGPHDSGARPQ